MEAPLPHPARPAPGPLAGLRVLDLASVILGPFATMLLGDLGAEVIKVERPEGDSSRHVTPGRHPGMSGTAINLHRNKRSIALDLRNPAGRAALLRLAGSADALIHNIRPQAMARLGLDYAALQAARPDIVYCACTGYGSGGPYAGRPAYDDLVQGASGVACLMGRVHGKPEYVPVALCDKTVAMAAVNALLAALLHRARTGEGQEVEVPMYETMVAFNMAEHVCDSVFEPPEAPFGYPRVLSPGRHPYPTRNGHLCLLPYTDRQWRAFFRIIDREALAEDPRFRHLAGRTQHVDELYRIVEEEVARRSTEEWLELCEQEQIPAMPVLDLADARQDPHLAASGFFTVREHPSEGRYLSVGIPPRYSRTPCAVTRDAPRLGEHGIEILHEAGFGEEEIAALQESGALGDGSAG